MSLLDTDLRDQIFAGLKGRLLKGIARRYSAPQSGGLDQLGDPVDAPDHEDWVIEGFRDEYSRFTHAQAGIPETDYKICIFAGSAPDYAPKAGDLVRLDYKAGAQWSRLRGEKGGIRIDPAGALWECQAFAAEAPQ